MDIVNLFRTQLWTFISDMTISACLVAIIATLFTESIKISVEKVFKQVQPKWVSWVVNLIVVLTITSFFMLVATLSGKPMETWKLSFYIAITSALSWGIATLGYTYILKLFITGVQIAVEALKKFLAQLKLESQTLINELKKQKEVSKKILLKENLEKLKEGKQK